MVDMAEDCSMHEFIEDYGNIIYGFLILELGSSGLIKPL